MTTSAASYLSDAPEPPPSKPGLWILLEGGDGAGKSAQSDILARWLRSQTSVAVNVTYEPFVFSDQVRAIKLRPMAELMLFLSDRAEYTEVILKPSLENGTIVVQDRGYPSTIAYQGYGRGLPSALIYELNQRVQPFSPDLTLWLDVPPEIGLARSEQGDRFEQEDLEFHQRVYQGYRDYATRPGVVRIDATQSKEAVSAAIQAAVTPVLTHWLEQSGELK